MTQRMIDDGWTSNPDFQRLPPVEQLLALALWNVADAVGRGPADPRWVRSKACPFTEDSLSELQERLQHIAATLNNPNQSPGRLMFYEANGAMYYQFQDFAMFQRFTDPPTPDHPDPPGYTWVADRSDRRRKYAGRWEPTAEAETAQPPHGAAQGKGASVPSEEKREEADAETRRREEEIRQERLQRAAEAEGLPDGYVQLKACHEHYSGRLFSLDDDVKLRGALKDAAEAGVPWMVLLTMMKDAQRDYKPTNTNPIIKAISYYCMGWDRHIREAMAETQQPAARRTPATQTPEMRPPNTDAMDPRERIRQERAAALSGEAYASA